MWSADFCKSSGDHSRNGIVLRPYLSGLFDRRLGNVIPSILDETLPSFIAADRSLDERWAVASRCGRQAKHLSGNTQVRERTVESSRVGQDFECGERKNVE